MAEAFIVRRGGGGGSGGTLVVTSSGAGTVTVSNSTLGKSYSKSVTAGGSVTFKGLKTGEWTVTLSNGAQIATRSVTINADYSVSVAYFSATISITYPATSTCVVTNSGGQTVASDTNTGSSTKTWTATVNATGTYTVAATATDGTDTASMTVSITYEGQAESVELNYNFYLYKSGDQMEEITGGWKAHYSNSDGASFGSDKISLWGRAQTYTGAVQTVNKIDFSKFRELSVICVDPTTGVVVRLSTYKTTERFRDENIAKASGDNPGTASIDLSNIDSSGYVALYSDKSATVTEVYLK